MQRYFNSKEAAQRHLEVKRKAILKKMALKGDKVVADNSYVYQRYLWQQQGHMCIQTNILKWYVFMAIVTEELIKDLQNMPSIIDVQTMETILIDEVQNNISKDIIRQIYDFKH